MGDVALISFSLLVLYFHSRGNLEKNGKKKDLKTPRIVIFFSNLYINPRFLILKAAFSKNFFHQGLES